MTQIKNTYIKSLNSEEEQDHIVSRLAEENEQWNPSAIFFGSDKIAVLDSDLEYPYEDRSYLRVNDGELDKILKHGDVVELHDDYDWMDGGTHQQKIVVGVDKWEHYGLTTFTIHYVSKDSDYAKINKRYTEHDIYSENELVMQGKNILKLFVANEDYVVIKKEYFDLRNLYEESFYDRIDLKINYRIHYIKMDNGKTELHIDFEYKASPRVSSCDGGHYGKYEEGDEKRSIDDMIQTLKERFPKRPVKLHVNGIDERKKQNSLEEFF